MLVRVSKPVPPRRDRFKYQELELQRLEREYAARMLVWAEQRTLYQDAARCRKLLMERRRKALKSVRATALPIDSTEIVASRGPSQALSPVLPPQPVPVAFTEWLTEWPEAAARATERVAARAAVRAAAAVLLCRHAAESASQSSSLPPPQPLSLVEAFDRMCLSGAPDTTSPLPLQPPPLPRPRPPPPPLPPSPPPPPPTLSHTSSPPPPLPPLQLPQPPEQLQQEGQEEEGPQQEGQAVHEQQEQVQQEEGQWEHEWQEQQLQIVLNDAAQCRLLPEEASALQPPVLIPSLDRCGQFAKLLTGVLSGYNGMCRSPTTALARQAQPHCSPTTALARQAQPHYSLS